MASNDDLLFAEHVVRAGFLTQDAVDDSLEVQTRMAEMGVRDTLANILVKRGVIKEADAALICRRAGLKSGREPIPGYQLVRRIGTGAMGSVYLAFHRGMKRNVAIKILRRDLTDDPRQVERLRREAHLVGQLDHPHVVRGLDSGESGGLVWFVMEFVDGTTLRRHIRDRGRLPLDEALEITIALADAIAHAHSHGVVHRDIKPGNVLLTRDLVPRLSDYGLAKGESDDALTHVDATLGTPQYVAPEQARNPRDADIRSDIYSLGATLYTMLAGHPPYEGDTLAEILTKVLYQRPKPLEQVVPGISPAAVFVVEKMMAKRNESRYATPTELLVDLRALARGKLHVPMGFRGDFEEFVAVRRQRKQWISTAAVAVAIVALVAGGAAWNKRIEQDRIDEVRRTRYASIDRHPGDRGAWSRATVETMVGELEDFLHEYPAHPDATRALARWRRQAEALTLVNALNKDAASHTGPWPPLLGRIASLHDGLQKRNDVDVALREVADHLNRARTRRAQEAEAQFVEESAAAEALSLPDAAAAFDALDKELRERFYGRDPAPFAERSHDLGSAFGAAQQRLVEHFADFDFNAGERGGLQQGRYRDLKRLLDQSSARCTDDAELRRALADLPPRNRRGGEPLRFYEERLKKLQRACADGWVEVEREVNEFTAQMRYNEAILKIEEFNAQSIEPVTSLITDTRTSLEEARDTGGRTLAAETASTERKFLNALGALEYGTAADYLTELEALAVVWPERDNPALPLVRGGRKLLELIEIRAWGALRRRLGSDRPLTEGIQFGTIRWQPKQIERLTLTDERVSIWRKGGDKPFHYELTEVLPDDLIHYAKLSRGDPADALVIAALRLTAYTPPVDRTRVADDLRDIESLLVNAQTDPALHHMAQRLQTLRWNILLRAQEELDRNEDQARREYLAALEAFKQGSFDVAGGHLRLVLQIPLNRTDYVRQQRRQIESLADSVSRALATRDYADFFPGARLIQRPDGRRLLRIDFEDGRVGDWMSLEDGVVGPEARDYVVSDAAAGALGDAAGVSEVGHVLAWRPWNGDEARHPRLFPVGFLNPFDYRRPIELSFLYRSDAPYALILSIGGATCGVLSSEGDREGGRGVLIWHANDLTRPDAAFGDRHRPGFLAGQPKTGRAKGDTEFFQFRPGRVYRVRFVKEEYKAKLYVDGRLVQTGDIKPSPTGRLSDRIVLLSYTSGEIDELEVAGTLDPSWLKRRK